MAKSNGNQDGTVQIYRRILKYPPFLPKRKPGPMKILHHVDGGYYVSEAPEAVTTEDFEKFLVAMPVFRLVSESDEGATVVFHVSEVKKRTGAKDDKYIIDALIRLTKLTLRAHFNNPKGKKTIATHIIHHAEIDPQGVITLILNRTFWEWCKAKGLKINTRIYSELRPATKNLYSFLIANPSSVFHEDTLIERAVIQASRKCDAQVMLRDALNELVEKGIIRGYNRYKSNGTWHIEVQRLFSISEFTTAVVKNLPQQS